MARGGIYELLAIDGTFYRYIFRACDFGECGVCVADVENRFEWAKRHNFAKKIADLNLHGINNITFVIGGAFGVSDKLRAAADFRLSLSRMTFTHQMTRVILIEQIYRAFKIIRGEKYHW